MVNGFMEKIEERVDYFKNDCFAQGLSSETCSEYSSVVKEFLIITGNPAVDYNKTYIDFKKDLEIFRLYLLKQDLSYSRVKYKFTAINNWYRLLLDDGTVSINPVPEYRKRYIRSFKGDRPPERQLIS